MLLFICDEEQIIWKVKVLEDVKEYSNAVKIHKKHILKYRYKTLADKWVSWTHLLTMGLKKLPASKIE